MTETEFRKLLNKLDGYFIPRQIGSTAKEWITAGSLLGETSIADIKQILSKEPINCHFSELGDDIRIRRLYTSDAADDTPCVDLGDHRISK